MRAKQMLATMSHEIGSPLSDFVRAWVLQTQIGSPLSDIVGTNC